MTHGGVCWHVSRATPPILGVATNISQCGQLLPQSTPKHPSGMEVYSHLPCEDRVKSVQNQL